jgi:nifR3 family TIM-barrel protein
MTDWPFQPFRIGRVEISSPVFLAPLAGYTDLPFRTICRRLGAPLCASEMMLDTSLLTRGKLQTRLVASDADDHPLIGQLVGNEPGTLARAARVLDERGFDIVDLNFACPVNKALKRRRGGWLVNEPDRAVEIVRAVVEAVDRPVTVKTRRRFADADDDANFWRIARGARDAGAAGLCIHARSVEQKYRGRADWDLIAEVRRGMPDWTVIGSGDVLTPQAALEMLARTGVDAVIAARGAMGNPWFFRQVAELAEGREPTRPTLAEQREVLLEHMRLAVELYGPERGPKVMRHHAIKYARMHRQPKLLRMAFVEVKSADQWRDVVERYYPADG